MADSFEKRRRERRKQEKRLEKELRKQERGTDKGDEGEPWVDEDGNVVTGQPREEEPREEEA
jgi:hypothetical protein